MNAKLQPLLLFRSTHSCIYNMSMSSKSNLVSFRRASSTVTTQSTVVHPSSSSSPPEAVVKRSGQSVSGWKGLEQWRQLPIEERRVWGKNTPVVEKEPILGGGLELLRRNETPDINVSELAQWGELILATADPLEKAFLTHQAFRLWHDGDMEIGTGAAPDNPGRPSKPELVPPREVPGPKDTDLGVSAHAMHNLAHIELNAIDLAWDTVVRFSHASEELGRQFFADFLRVADDESRHFRWCLQRLNELGFSYGDMPAHNMLWKDCMRTSGSVKARLAVIPMIQEARGLDASPRLVKRLSGLADHRSAAIVRQIGKEEVAHVGVGVTWFLRVCEQLQIDPGLTFKEMIVDCKIQLHGPFNHTERAKAGLQREWYDNPETKSSETGPVDSTKYYCQDPPLAAPTNGSTKEEVSEMKALVEKRLSEFRRESEVDVRRNPKLPVVTTETLDDQLAETNSCGFYPTYPREVDNGSARLLTSSKDVPKIPAAEEKKCGSSSSLLPEVFERLALLVAMEKDNAGG